LSNWTTLINFVSKDKKRELHFYKKYFLDFLDEQSPKVQNKILWTLRLIEELNRVPEIYLKYLQGSNGLYE